MEFINTKPAVTLGAVKVLCHDEEGSYEIIILKSGGIYSVSLNASGVAIKIDIVA